MLFRNQAAELVIAARQENCRERLLCASTCTELGRRRMEQRRGCAPFQPLSDTTNFQSDRGDFRKESKSSRLPVGFGVVSEDEFGYSNIKSIDVYLKALHLFVSLPSVVLGVARHSSLASYGLDIIVSVHLGHVASKH